MTDEEKLNREPETPEAPETAAEAAPAEEAPETPGAAPEAPLPDDAAKKVAEAEKKAADMLAFAQRTQADFENYRRRNEAARGEAFEDGRHSVATQMLTVLDNLERAVDAAADTPDDDPLKAGVSLTLRQLKETFTRMGIEAIDRAGEPFDPGLENAVLQGTPEDGAPGTVCQVLQKGYRMGKAVLRPAMVKVVPED